MEKNGCEYLVHVNKIIIDTCTYTMSVDVSICIFDQLPIIEIINVIIDHLDDISGIELPINFNPSNFRETPAIVFQYPKDANYFKEQIIKFLKKEPFVLKFFEEGENSQKDA